jgi:hypothetical protein
MVRKINKLVWVGFGSGLVRAVMGKQKNHRALFSLKVTKKKNERAYGVSSVPQSKDG